MTDHDMLDHDIISDGRTVWVNGSDGGCLARFGPLGIDVHYNSEAQLLLGRECITCTHDRTTFKDWRSFQGLTYRYHRVVIGDDHMPYFIRADTALGPYDDNDEVEE